MLHRLILALLMALVAIPAAAAPSLHASQAQAAAMACHETRSHNPQGPDHGTPLVQHDGICCAAFYGAPAAPLASTLPVGPVPLDMARDGLALPRAGPDVPPPKA